MEKKLQKAEAIDKFRALVEQVNVCMFTTSDDSQKITSRPMSTIKVDDEGNAWFFTNEFSEKIHELSKDNKVSLIYAHPGKNIYVHVTGSCSMVVDKVKVRELWSPLLKAWFPKGIDDPKLCLVKVTTKEAYYWNDSSSQMKVFFSMLAAIVKHEQYEEGEMGKLQLNDNV